MSINERTIPAWGICVAMDEDVTGWVSVTQAMSPEQKLHTGFDIIPAWNMSCILETELEAILLLTLLSVQDVQSKLNPGERFLIIEGEADILCEANEITFTEKEILQGHGVSFTKAEEKVDSDLAAEDKTTIYDEMIKFHSQDMINHLDHETCADDVIDVLLENKDGLSFDEILGQLIGYDADIIAEVLKECIDRNEIEVHLWTGYSGRSHATYRLTDSFYRELNDLDDWIVSDTEETVEDSTAKNHPWAEKADAECTVCMDTQVVSTGSELDACHTCHPIYQNLRVNPVTFMPEVYDASRDAWLKLQVQPIQEEEGEAGDSAPRIDHMAVMMKNQAQSSRVQKLIEEVEPRGMVSTFYGEETD